MREVECHKWGNKAEIRQEKKIKDELMYKKN